MLARVNRITKPAQFRQTLALGLKFSSPNLVLNALRESSTPETPARIGFIVGKACGSAVDRNRIKRRLRAISASRISSISEGTYLVVRALPAARRATFAALERDFAETVDRALSKFAETS